MTKVISAVALTLLVIVLAVYFLSRGGDSSQTPKGPRSDHLHLVIDPTVFDSSGRHNFERYLKQLEGALTNLPLKVHVTVWSISGSGDESAFVLDETLEIDRQAQIDTTRSRKLQSMCAEIKDIFLTRWDSLHSEPTNVERSSCIINLLRTLSKLSPESSSTNEYVLVLSDFVESCNGWPSINLDVSGGLRSAMKLPDDVAMIDLSRLRRVYFVKVPDRWTKTPRDDKALEDFWLRVIDAMKISRDRFYYGYIIPERIIDHGSVH
ncbi:MAG: hypothetical protein ABSF91_08315 [Bacteroidota bacterium]|jgi:hypothetical protein